ncbi:amino acid adenylation domain-containing protein [Streptomyces sp. NPDC057854]|uniref:amino acid adenylation domain-containing protein n=1 Tax=unclassified Streptomyces TaxID=2593676 RepID=UPI0036746E73
MRQTTLEAVLPLTPLQQGMLFHALFDGDGVDAGTGGVDFYNVQTPLELVGALDPEVLRGSCAALLARHGSLRAGFLRRRSGEAVQAVARAVEPHWEEADLSGFGPDERTVRLTRLLTEDRARRFDMARPPLLRCTLVKLAPEHHVLVVTHHHILLDGWSVPLVLGDLFRIYRDGGSADALEPAVPFADYLGWLGAQDREHAERAWRTALAGVDGPTLVAGGHGTRDSDRGQRRVVAELSEAATARVAQAARAREVTLNTVVQAAWALLLTSLTGRPDVVFGNTVAGRPPELAGADRMVGLMINTVPARIRVDPAETAAALLGRVQAEQTDLLGHQYLGLADIQRAVGVTELFDTTLAFENYPVEEAVQGAQVAGLTVSVLRDAAEDTPEGTHYPLSLAVYPGPRLRLELNHREDVYGTEEATAILDRLAPLLEALTGRPDVPVAQLPVWTEAQHDALLAVSRGRTAAHPPQTLHALFEEQARATPDAVAAVDATGRLTFAALDADADRLARRLTARGAGPGHLVAVALPRTTAAVSAILAVLKSGAAYLPLDADQPADRIAALCAEAGPALVVADATTRHALPDDVPVLLADAGDDSPEPGADAPRPAGPADLAYVVYTSGSTGRPKGVAVEHRNLVNMFHSHRANFFTPEREAAGGRPLRAALTNSLGFDASWSQLLWMVAGNELHIVDDTVRKDALALVAYAADAAVDVLDTTPSVARQLLAAGLLDGSGGGHRIRTLALGGEEVGDDLWTELRALPGLSVYNLYGPAECTVDAMLCRAADSDRPSLGGPADNTDVHVLDGFLRPVPVGVVGEIYIAGAGVARGYVGRPGLTAERFVADVGGAPGARMYRTGDLGRRRADGAVEYCGRVDFQVKVRGHRVELGEIEAVLASDPGVAQAVVAVVADAAGTRHVVGYVRPVAGAVVDGDVLRERVAVVLPDYMVPVRVLVVDAFALTPNGKVDRRALPALELKAVREYRAPSTERERVLHEVFAEVLGRDRVGVDDSFFDLGGDSIVSMRLAARAHRAGLVLSAKDVFVHKTIAALAEVARDVPQDAGADLTAAGPLVDLDDAERAELDALAGPVADVWTLTPLQQGMHFHALLATDALDVYVTQRPLRLTGTLAPAVLRDAFDALLARHPALRTSFVTLGSGRSVQVVHDDVRVPWEERDLSGLAPAEREARLAELLDEDRVRRFATDRPPLLRVALVKLAADEHLLLVTHHHLLLDGWSLPLVFRDLFASYARGGTGTGTPPVPFDRFLRWLAAQDEQAAVAAWRAELAGLDEPALVAPGSDAATATVPELVATALDAEATERLTDTARQAGLTLNTLVQGAWAIALGQFLGRDDVVFGATTAGRPPELPGAEDMVGLLMNTVAVRVRLDPGRPLRDALAALQETQAGLRPFHHLGLAEVQRAAGIGELFDTVVGFENTPVDGDAVQAQVPGLRIGVDDTPAPGASHYPFSLVVVPSGRLSLELTYRADLFTAAEAAAVLHRVRAVLDAFAQDPAVPVGRIDLRTDAERAEPVRAGAATPPRATFPALFEAHAAARPDAVAVYDGPHEVTYGTLDAEANRLARVLAARGVGPGNVVAVALPRSARSVLAVLAVLKSGAAYLPLDLGYPPERLRYIIDDARPDLVLTTADGSAVTAAAGAGAGRTLSLDGDGGALTGPDDPFGLALELTTGLSGEPLRDDERSAPLTAGSAAYLIYTSGSTGRPKGVLVPHTGIAALAAQQRTGLALRDDERVLMFASPSFDASVWELATALLNGASVVAAPADDLLPGPSLAATVARHGVTTLLLPPSSLAVLPEGALPPGVTLVVGGEACTPDLVERWSAGRRMVNAYGPTEATVMATMSGPLAGRTHPPLGEAVAGARVHLLDSALRPVPVGAPGELYLAGEGLALGYLRRPGQTGERFVADPYGPPGTRMYRSGDLARRRPDGTLEYLGRADRQVKVRGFRIEPGEIEAVLAEDAAVAGAAVVVREDQPGVRRLVGYVSPAGGLRPDPAALRDRVAAALPPYMVPAAVVVLDRLPVTPGGKLDRDALPAPDFAAAADSRAPRNAREEQLCALFAKALGTGSVGIDDGFFDLGGDSIVSIKLVTLARAEGLDMTPKDVFTHKTVAALATAVKEIDPAGGASAGGDGDGSDEPLVTLDQDELAEFAEEWSDPV